MDIPVLRPWRKVMSDAESMRWGDIEKYLLSLSAWYFFNRTIILDSDFDKELEILSFLRVSAEEFHAQNDKVETKQIRFTTNELKKMIEYLDRDGFVYIASWSNGREIRLKVQYQEQWQCDAVITLTASKISKAF